MITQYQRRTALNGLFTLTYYIRLRSEEVSIHVQLAIPPRGIFTEPESDKWNVDFFKQFWCYAILFHTQHECMNISNQ